MADVKTEFVRHCGNDVEYVGHGLKGRDLEIRYKVIGKKHEMSMTMRLMNGSDSQVRDRSRTAGVLAAQAAYRITGKAEADMKSLAEGKLP